MTVRLLALAVALLGGCHAPAHPRSGGGGRAGAPRWVQSNVLRQDYAGSASCASCHSTIYDKWRASPMRNMTRRIAEARIDAPFDGRTFRFKQDSVVLETVAGERRMRFDSRYAGKNTYRITRVIGGRYREDFVGVRITGHPTGRAAEELVLPVSWVRFARELRYKGYSVMLPERPGLKPGPVWRKTCILCHNTAPQLTYYYDDLYRGPKQFGYQGTLGDSLLPPSRAWRLEPRDVQALRSALGAEIVRLWAPRRVRWQTTPLDKLLRGAAYATRRHLDESHLIEVGIGCEACHGGSKEHVEHPELRPSFKPRTKLFRVIAPRALQAAVSAGGRAPWINRTCLRCHNVLFSGYPHTWEGGLRSHHPGGSNINSSEARDLALGRCFSKLACSTCHDPHTRDSRAKLDALATPAKNRVCTRCHGKYAAASALRAHAHHDPARAGGSCIACHMPKKNMGLRYALTRYHRIGAPNDRARVERDRPLECALCHPQRSVESLVTTMERWWGKGKRKPFDRAALEALYGADLSKPVMMLTLARGRAHEKAVAMTVLGEARVRAALPAIVNELDNTYPLVRYFARQAIRDIDGKPLNIDMSLPGETLRARARAALGIAAH